MPLENTGFAAIPGISAALETVEANIFWGPMEYNRSFILPVTLDGSSVDQGASPTTNLRPGLLMAQVTSTGKYKPWDPTATDGTEKLVGPLLYDQTTLQAGVATDRWFGYVVCGGLIRASGLIFDESGSTPGIAGLAEEWLIRNAMAGRFVFDDTVALLHGDGYNRIANKTADYSVLASDNNTLFHNLGDANAIVYTLPAIATAPGLRYLFFNAVDQNMTVASAAAGGLITFNNAAADSVALSTTSEKIGGWIEVVAISTAKWAVRHSGANTLTVA